MNETSLDFDGSGGRRPARGMVRASHLMATAATAALFFCSSSAQAQLPGAPVLQNAWATPGMVAAVNYGGGPDGSVFAGAIGWTPGAGRFQVSGGVGYQSRKDFSSRAVYGARVAIPFSGPASTFGFGAFAGIGGGPAGTKTTVVSTIPGGTPSVTDSVTSTTQIPIGAAVGWRHAIGATHGLSVYATPSYVFFTGGSSTKGLVRTAVGADLGVTQSIGATLGIEFGQSRGRGVGGPSGTLYGLGVSYAFGRR